MESARVGVRIVSDTEIAELNEKHLGHEGPTDVITFDLRDEGSNCVEGELAISVDTARREAQRRGHEVYAELALYAVHGTLHLMGHDDAASNAANEMHALEDDILRSVGVGTIYASKNHKACSNVRGGRLPRSLNTLRSA